MSKEFSLCNKDYLKDGRKVSGHSFVLIKKDKATQVLKCTKCGYVSVGYKKVWRK